MRREQTLEEISDGKLYDSNDMVKADCQDCKGCFDCCTGMGDSVVLDPLDVWRLSQGLHLSVDQLLAGKIELGVTDGNILPHLRMTGAEERCVSEWQRKMLHPQLPSGLLPFVPTGKILRGRWF